jgi:peptidoglycan-N-acetylglucosamine deacetylase
MAARTKVVFGILGILLSFPVFAHTHTPTHTCSAVAAKGTVALTFDDGPSKIYTPKILKILEKNHIHATFFVVGENAKARPQLLKKEIADGDIVGNHSFSHKEISRLSGEELYEEVMKPESIISKIIGKKPTLFRFPYGAENKRVIQYVEAQGLTPVNWENCPQDYKRPGANVIAERVVKHARSGQVILLHDGPARRQQTVDALPKIISGIRKKGLGFSVLCT